MVRLMPDFYAQTKIRANCCAGIDKDIFFVNIMPRFKLVVGHT